MKTVNMHEAKTHLSRLVEEAAEGKEIIIAKAGKPRARLVPCAPARKKKRKLGWMKGQIWMSEDFNAPLSDEDLRLWGMKD
ncbi:MAG: type II toxin-antitoxin system Phd/YefM family antitoxin [Candidatus Binataceae bacterium]